MKSSTSHGPRCSGLATRGKKRRAYALTNAPHGTESYPIKLCGPFVGSSASGGSRRARPSGCAKAGPIVACRPSPPAGLAVREIVQSVRRGAGPARSAARPPPKKASGLCASSPSAHVRAQPDKARPSPSCAHIGKRLAILAGWRGWGLHGPEARNLSRGQRAFCGLAAPVGLDEMRVARLLSMIGH